MSNAFVIALVNNMPDPALRTTEQQFRELLGDAAGADHEIQLRLFSFPEIIRSDECRSYIAREYDPIEELWQGAFDGLIVTGAEPRTAAIHDELYWPSLTRLVELAMDSGTPTVWSCLAAHAAVLCLDGIERRRLTEKLSGMFCCTKLIDDPLVAGLPDSWYLPHSRLNTIDATQLVPAGYEIVSCSVEAGVDAFILRRRACFVFYQGHPEYDPGALFREYRRDVGRFLTGTMDRYPEMPRSYLDDETAKALTAFRARAVRERRPTLLEEFPAGATREKLQHHWQEVAVQLYRNWLTNIITERGHEGVSAGAAPVVASAS
jgi:homoserine O-succinyltransferase/O-acetyltransferase